MDDGAKNQYHFGECLRNDRQPTQTNVCAINIPAFAIAMAQKNGNITRQSMLPANTEAAIIPQKIAWRWRS